MTEQQDAAAYAHRVMRIEGLIATAQGTLDTIAVSNLDESDVIFFRDHLLMQWELAKLAIVEATEHERMMRRRCVEFAFDPEKTKGTERIALGNGYEAKAVKKINFSWIKSGDGVKIDRKAINAALEEIEATGPMGELIAERLVKWNPDLAEGEYNKLEQEHPEFKKIIDRVIVTTQALPSLEIVAPKEKKR